MNTNQIPPIPPAMPQANPGSSHSIGMKILLIGLLVVILIIPMLFIHALIGEREDRQREAAADVRQSWSGGQILAGPSLTIPYTTLNKEGERVVNHINYLPDTLEISGTLQTRQLRRGIYDIVVYEAPILISGTFSAADLRALRVDPRDMRPAEATLNIGVSDLRGICEQVDIQWGDLSVPAHPGTAHASLMTSGISIPADATPLLRPDGSVAFSAILHLRGSAHLFFAPLGRTTKVNLASNCPAPSFTGAFLPRERNVSEKGFAAQWQVLELNRNYPQAIVGGLSFANHYDNPDLPLPKDGDYSSVSLNILPSLFGVNLLLPVDQYQQTTRAAKYAFLVIILTFVICFFTEVFQRRDIHPAQYLLVGLALCLFYTLLLATAEHTGFTPAYALASVMTVGLITFYLAGVLHIRRTALTIGALLACLYAYVYLLIRMDTYALLAGSLGLFAILAVVMYFSQKIKWQ